MPQKLHFPPMSLSGANRAKVFAYEGIVYTTGTNTCSGFFLHEVA